MKKLFLIYFLIPCISNAMQLNSTINVKLIADEVLWNTLRQYSANCVKMVEDTNYYQDYPYSVTSHKEQLYDLQHQEKMIKLWNAQKGHQIIINLIVTELYRRAHIEGVKKVAAEIAECEKNQHHPEENVYADGEESFFSYSNKKSHLDKLYADLIMKNKELGNS